MPEEHEVRVAAGTTPVAPWRHDELRSKAVVERAFARIKALVDAEPAARPTGGR